MALYSYQATDASGRFIKGTLTAQSDKALIDHLQEMGYLPINFAIEGTGSGSGYSSAPVQAHPFFSSLFKPRVPRNSVMHFTNELASMLDAGLTLDRSFSILADLERNPAFKEVIISIHKGVTAGRTLADSLAEHPGVFSEIYVSMVRAGEAAGALESVFVRLTEYMEASRKLKDDITSALIYPLLLTFVGGSAIMTMMLFVIPKFAVMFSDNKMQMPLPTRMLMSVSDAVSVYWWVMIIAVVVAAFVLRRWGNTPMGRLSLDSFKLRLPIFGPIAQKVVLSRFSRTLGSLLSGGLPILDALNISVRTMGNEYMAADIKPVIEGVRSGRGVSAPLNDVASFPPLAVHMLTVGEETGKLDEMLVKLAGNYDRDIDISVKRLLSLMEPAIILVMAVVVGFIVISLLLAIFSLNDMPL